MAISRDDLLELSGRDAYTMHHLWQSMMRDQIKATDQFDLLVEAALKYIEETGCSVEWAVEKKLNDIHRKELFT
jgi:hypothetical protein